MEGTFGWIDNSPLVFFYVRICCEIENWGRILENIIEIFYKVKDKK